MKNVLRFFLIATVFFVGVGAFANVTHAALVECGTAPAGSVSGGFISNECTMCDLQKLAVRFVNFVIITAASFSAILFMYAGYMYITSAANPGNISRAHHIFIDTLIGFIIILGAWLIVNLIMSTLYQTDLGDWRGILCDTKYQNETSTTTIAPLAETTTSTGVINTTNSGSGYTGSYGSEYSATPSTTGGLSDDEAREQLLSNVSVWESAPGMTTFDGMQQTTIDGVNALATDSGLSKGEFVITGAVDSASTAHTDNVYSHGTGYKVDLDDTTAMNNYITTSFSPSGYTSKGEPIYTATVNGTEVTAVKESTHWDLKFIPKTTS